VRPVAIFHLIAWAWDIPVNIKQNANTTVTPMKNAFLLITSPPLNLKCDTSVLLISKTNANIFKKLSSCNSLGFKRI
jgi:hypothetical protein